MIEKYLNFPKVSMVMADNQSEKPLNEIDIFST